LDVQALDQVEPTERGIAFDVRVSAPTNYKRSDQPTAVQDESKSGDETPGDDTADDDHGGGPDMAAESSAENDVVVKEFGESVEAATDTDDQGRVSEAADVDEGDEEHGEEDTEEVIGEYTARDYGLVLSMHTSSSTRTV